MIIFKKHVFIIFMFLMNVNLINASEVLKSEIDPHRKYDKLAIIAVVPEETKNKIRFGQVISEEEKKKLASNGFSYRRTITDNMHMSLFCINGNNPLNPALHVEFDANYVESLKRIAERFAGNPRKKASAGYNFKVLSVQLWVATDDPLQGKQNLHFTVKPNPNEIAFKTADMLKMLKGKTASHAHIVLRVGNQSMLRDDWDELVVKGETRNGRFYRGLIAQQEKDTGKPLSIYNSYSGKPLSTHISIARLNKYIPGQKGLVLKDKDFDTLLGVFGKYQREFDRRLKMFGETEFLLNELAITTVNDGNIEVLPTGKITLK